MKTVEDELSDSGFSVCNSGCIVNLKLIGQVTPNCVIINGEQIPLSRRRIKDFKKRNASGNYPQFSRVASSKRSRDQSTIVRKSF